MDEKTKLLIFEKKEVFLIFIFVILVAITSFTIGIRIGKNFALKQSGVTHEDVKKVANLKSTEEEQLEELMKKGEGGTSGTHEGSATHGSHGEAAPVEHGVANSGHDPHAANPSTAHGAAAEVKPEAAAHTEAVPEEKETSDPTLKKLEAEFKKLDSEEKSVDSNKKKLIEASEEEITHEKLKSLGETTASTRKEGKESAKFTIQLGSYPTLQEAEKFADGFRIRGYNPIVYETTLPNKGIWYRVSLGSFDSMSEAKSYVQKEESLFAGQEYVITEMK